MKAKQQNKNGLNRIDEIKNKISSCDNKKFCTVEVYESWNSMFEETEGN